MTAKEIAEVHEVDYEKLTKNEIKQINRMIYFGKEELIEFNKKGHLIIEQRYPNLPIYISLLAIVISSVSIILLFVNM